MAYRILATAAVLVALAAPVMAETTTITATRECHSHYSRSSRSGNWRECTTDVRVQRPEPYKPNCAYLPNFGGVNPRCKN